MPPTVATTAMVSPLAAVSVPRDTSRLAPVSCSTSFRDLAISATSSVIAPMMAMVCMGFLSVSIPWIS